MSLIKGDGGGTQYTFFETWNAGTGLIIHADWLRPDDEMRPGVNCIAVDGPAELASALLTTPSDAVLAGGARTMQTHAPQRVAPALLRALEEP